MRWQCGTPKDAQDGADHQKDQVIRGYCCGLECCPQHIPPPTARPPAWTRVPALSSSATSLHITAWSPLSLQALLPEWAGPPDVMWSVLHSLHLWHRLWASLVAQRQRIHLPVQETQARSLGREDPLEATHFGILAWEIPWTGEPGGLQSTGPQRVRHD